MANWAYIENNEIIELFESLPKSWKNVSNLDASENNIDFLKSIGWYPINNVNKDYDPSRQTIRPLSITFDGDNVYQTHQIEDISIDTLYDNFMTELRKHRDMKLSESDYMCSIDIVLSKGNNYIKDIADYRQQLRDLPSLYPNLGITYSIFEIVWPNKPNLNDYPNIDMNYSIFGGI